MPNPDILIRTGGHQRLEQFYALAASLFRVIFFKKIMARF